MEDTEATLPEADAAAAEPERAKRRQVLAGARRTFVSRGFDAASMGEIAREAGVSKGTLYVYFDSKEALFAALLDEAKGDAAENALVFDPEEPDVARALTDFGHRLLQKLAAPEHVALVRMVIGAGDRFPDLARAFYDAGPRRGRQALIAYLTEQAARGKLTIENPTIAASQFLGMCSHLPVMRCLLGGDPLPEGQTPRTYAAAAARTFMAAYGAEPGSGASR